MLDKAFNKRLSDRVDSLVSITRTASDKKYGQHTSEHQAFAVLHEEVDELNDNTEKLSNCCRKLWESVKKDDDEQSIAMLMAARGIAHAAIIEAIQVTAMVDKSLDYYKSKEHNKPTEQATVRTVARGVDSDDKHFIMEATIINKGTNEVTVVKAYDNVLLSRDEIDVISQVLHTSKAALPVPIVTALVQLLCKSTDALEGSVEL